MMLKRTTSMLLALFMALSGTIYAAAASATEQAANAISASAANLAAATAIVLADNGITVDGEPASTDASAAVYTGADIVYYQAGQGTAYGEGTAADEHEASEAALHTVVTITQPGAYRVSGALSAGQLAIDLGEEAVDDPSAVVTLILDGVDITSTVAPAVIFYNVYEPYSATEDTGGVVDLAAAGAQVIIADGSANNVKGAYVARIYKEGTTKKRHKYDGAFYSKMSMNISGEAAGTGELRITASNEGLDSELHLAINGGRIYIESRDDGINTNEDLISVTTINGGYLYVNAGLGAEGDGIDSNGYLTINGGEIITMSNDRSPDGGIDADKDITINGGTVIALGTRNDAASDKSAQPFMELQFASTQAAGTKIAIKDSTGNELLSHVADKAFQSLTFSSADLALNTEYWVYANGVQQQYTGNAFGMMGGGFPGGFFPEGGFPEGGFPEGGFPEGGFPEGSLPDRAGGIWGPRPNGQGGQGTAPGEVQAPPDGEFTPPEGMPAFPGSGGQGDPALNGQNAENAEASVAFIITPTVHSFSGVADSAEASGKERVTFTVNNGNGISSVASGAQVILEQIAASANVPDQDIQITITDIPSEDYSETLLLSAGIDALSAILPTADGTYQLTVAVVSNNETYTGISRWQFTIGGLPFTDLNPNHRAYNAVKALYEKGILIGTSATTFSPDAIVTRAAAVTALGRMLGVDGAETISFSDVQPGSWYSGYVGWASANGIVIGDGYGHFSPNKGITEAQMELILSRYATVAGISYESGSSGAQTLTRGELAVILNGLQY